MLSSYVSIFVVVSVLIEMEPH